MPEEVSLDEQVTNDLQLHIGRLTYNNMVLSARLDRATAELVEKDQTINELTQRLTPAE